MNKIFRLTADPFDCRSGQVWPRMTRIRQIGRLRHLMVIFVFQLKSFREFAGAAANYRLPAWAPQTLSSDLALSVQIWCS